jgi:hypothetical protein
VFEEQNGSAGARRAVRLEGVEGLEDVSREWKELARAVEVAEGDVQTVVGLRSWIKSGWFCCLFWNRRIKSRSAVDDACLVPTAKGSRN